MQRFSKEEAYKLIGFNDFKLRLFAIPFFSIFFPWLVIGASPFENFSEFSYGFLISVAHMTIYWHIDRYVVLILLTKYSKFADYKKRVVLEAILIIGITLALCSISYLLEFCFAKNGGVIEASLFEYVIGSLIITIIIVSIYEARYAFEKYKKGLIRNAELKKVNTKAQLEALKNQVNPHFFFNSINTLVSVIPEDPDTAVKFAENLSHVYRCILEMKDKEIVSLAEEFSCIQAYKYLLKIRFSDQVKFNGDEVLSTMTDQYIIPMSVQMLVENAVKHNVVSQSRPLTIDFEIIDDHLVVSNKRDPKNTPENSTKIGLKNIHKRYELLADKCIIIEETKERFSVSLPILKVTEVK